MSDWMTSAFVKLFLLIFATLPIQQLVGGGCALVVVGELRASTKLLDDVGQLLELLVQLVGTAALQNLATESSCCTFCTSRAL